MAYNRDMKEGSLEYTEIVQRIRYFREQKNMTQRTLSIALGKSENYVNKAESLDFKLPVDVLMEIIHLLGVPLTEFFYADIESFAADHEILSQFKDFTAEEKQALKKILETLRKNSSA